MIAVRLFCRAVARLSLTLLALAFGPALLQAQTLEAKTARPVKSVVADGAIVKVDSLRGGTPVTQDNPATIHKQERDGPVADRDFVQMPPLIPHTISGYQVTKNFNKCMDCHAWQKTRDSGATKISVTHFKNREGTEMDSVSPRRYFCTQCHVPQSDARPLVANTYQRAQGLR